MRARTRFVCQECGYDTPRWLGRCPGCGAWNRFAEERVPAPLAGARGLEGTAEAVPLCSVAGLVHRRLSTGVGELDRVLGGGLVEGALVLLGGDPGIGKSTLLLQACLRVAAGGRGAGAAEPPVLYVSGEESAQQVKLRADRLLGAGAALPPGLFILPSSDVAAVERAAEALSPVLMVVDSIQTMSVGELESAPGSVSQVRESAARIMRLCKARGLAAFLVGHINKEGALAGPKVLEHLVDAVLYLEGDRHYAYRVLRGVKNRFGSTREIGVFAMGDGGLEEVPNPSAFFLAERPAGAVGSAVAASLEGSRPVLVEVQALLTGPNPGTPRRTVTGLDHNRVALLLAVLEKRVGLALAGHDAYVKVVGGLRLDEPAVDLALAVALASAFRERPVDPGLVVAGEVGLGGEVRAVARAEERVREAARLGFRRVLLPRRNRSVLPGGWGELELCGVETVAQAIEAALTG